MGQYSIIGTAGHVDHGKTLLVKRLTGQDTDRLEQEKLRGISIELGFASMHLPGGTTLAFIDVPGHERFIRQMLAGAGGIRIFLLVVAADEGIKPQTREHLDILNLLGIPGGVAAITKCDLVPLDRVEEVKIQVRALVEEVGFFDIPIVPVSAVTGEGIETLVGVLDKISAKLPSQLCGGKMRMPVDRVFSLKGVGTVVTGTVWSGKISSGDKLEILPSGEECRVRGLHEHGRPVTETCAGHRTAINIAGQGLENLKRGTVIQTPGYLRPCTRADISIRLLPSAVKPLQHGQRVRFYNGTGEILGKVILLEGENILPGQRGYAQCILETPLMALPGDRMVIRTYSPMHTIGGADVISTDPPRRKRLKEDSLQAVACLHTGTPQAKLSLYIEESPKGILSLDEAAGMMGVPPEQVCDLCKNGGGLLKLEISGQEHITSVKALERLGNAVTKVLHDYHCKNPLRPGMPREELRSKKFSQYSQGEYIALLRALEDMKFLVSQGETVRLKDFSPRLEKKQLAKGKQIETRLLTNPFQPLLWPLISKELFYFNPREGEEIRQYLEETGIIVHVGENLYFHRNAIDRARDIIREHIDRHGSITSGEARDLLGSSRKYVIPLMEYFDEEGFTVRRGNERVLSCENFRGE